MIENFKAHRSELDSLATMLRKDAPDPDGDSLVYDWFTQIPLKIAGAPQEEYLYGTASNARVMYYAGPPSRAASVPTQVFARESSSGLQDGVAFRVMLKH